MLYREVAAGERFDTLVGWLETNDIPYNLRVSNGSTHIGLSAYHWRKAEYTGIAA